MNIEDLKSLMDAFDPAALLPDLSGLSGSLETVCRVAVMIGPVVLLVFAVNLTVAYACLKLYDEPVRRWLSKWAK